MLYNIKVKEFMDVVKLKKDLEEFEHVEDIEELADVLLLCNDFINACRVSDKTNKLAFGEFERRQKDAYIKLKETGAI